MKLTVLKCLPFQNYFETWILVVLGPGQRFSNSGKNVPMRPCLECNLQEIFQWSGLASMDAFRAFVTWPAMSSWIIKMSSNGRS